MIKKWIAVLAGIALVCFCALACAETIGGNTYYEPQTMTPFGGGSEDIYWTLDLGTGEMVISGTGEWAGYEWGNAFSPWKDVLGKIKSITVEDGVLNIASNAFAGCESLKGIDLPDGMTYINENAFRNWDGKRYTSLGSGTIAFDYSGIWNDPAVGTWMIQNGTIDWGYSGV